MKNKTVLFLSLLLTTTLIPKVTAHCPLCTAGAAVAAGGAIWLGVSPVVVALFIGAFAVSTGWWVSRLVKKQYIPFQKTLIVLLSFVLTIVPMLPVISSSQPFYLSLFGSYGSLFNRTYMINMSLITSIFGGLIVIGAPQLNKKIKDFFGKKLIPFQGVLLSLLLLIIAGAVINIFV